MADVSICKLQFQGKVFYEKCRSSTMEHVETIYKSINLWPVKERNACSLEDTDDLVRKVAVSSDRMDAESLSMELAQFKNGDKV